MHFVWKTPNNWIFINLKKFTKIKSHMRNVIIIYVGNVIFYKYWTVFASVHIKENLVPFHYNKISREKTFQLLADLIRRCCSIPGVTLTRVDLYALSSP